MPTRNFSFNAPGLVWLGSFNDGNSGGGHLSRRFDGSNSELRTVVTGTDFSLTYFSFSPGGVTLIIDGAQSRPVLSTSGWNTLAVFSGLSDAAHSVVLRSDGGSNLYLDQVLFAVTGSNPALAAPPGYSFSGRLVVTTDQGSPAPKIAPGGITGFTSNAGYYLSQNTWQGGLYGCGSYRFRASCTQIDLWLGTFVPTAWRVYVDGSPSAPVTVPVTSGLSYTRATLASGLDPTAVHEYELVVDDTTQYHQVYEVLLTGGTGFDAAAPVARGVFGVMGDSIAAGAMTDPTGGFASLLARSRELSCANAGLSSSCVSGPNSPMQSRTGSITQFGPAVREILFCGGVNDIILGQAVGDYRAAYMTTLQNLLSGCPAAHVWCVGILPNGYAGSPASTIASFNTAAQAAVTEVGSTRVRFIDPTPWAGVLAPGGDYSINFAGDKLHPNAAGHALIASLVDGAIRPASPARLKWCPVAQARRSPRPWRATNRMGR